MKPPEPERWSVAAWRIKLQPCHLHPAAASLRRKTLGRRLVPALLLALAPKCVLCLLAVTPLGVAAGLRAPELCGATPEAHASGILLPLGLGAALALAACRHLTTAGRHGPPASG